MAKKATDFARGLLLAFLSLLTLALVFPQPATCCWQGTAMVVDNDGTRAIVVDSVFLFDDGRLQRDASFNVAPHDSVTRLYDGWLDDGRPVAPDSTRLWYHVDPESIRTTLIAPVAFGQYYSLNGVENATVVFRHIVVGPEATPVGLTLAAVALALTGVWFLRKRFLRAQGGLGPTAAGTGG
jgi:hypothetical protein